MKHNFPKTVVAVQAHPDDTEIGCSGTMMLLREAGYRLVIVTVTPGGMGGVGSTEKETAAVRETEARKAADFIGADYYCLDGRDGFLFDTLELRLKVLEIIRREKAGIVFTHLPFDYHSDHRVTANIAEAATIIATLENAPVEQEPLDITPLLYHTAPLGSTDTLGNPVQAPHFAVDVSSVIDQKMQMLANHQTQIELMRRMHKMDDFFGEMQKQGREWGTMFGVEHAEVFWQHLGGGFQKDLLIQTEIAEFIVREKK